MIWGNCDLIARDCPSCGAGERIRDIRSAATRVEQILADGLGKDPSSPLRTGAASVNTIISEMANLGTLRRYVEVELQLDPNVPSLPKGFPETAFYRALMNLCSNAKHAMQSAARAPAAVYDSTGEFLSSDPPLCGTIVIRTKALPNETEISVSDTGPGMSPAQQRRLVQRMNGGPEAIEDGHGHGMQIVKAAVEQLRGRLELDSAPGVGTTFILHLPLA